jgi:phosphoribosylformimino-5-aminoimidazole carboxamide ribotide isomerase
MLLLPVLDLKAGLVVRGVGGRRHEYRPIVSQLTRSCRPVDVAQAFRDHFGLTELYLADLDAIAGGRPALSMYTELRAQGFRLRIDAGVRDAADARPLAEAGVEGIVAGLETLSGSEALSELCQEFGSRVIFSLDLKQGRPLNNVAAWESMDGWAIAEKAVELGVRSLIVLDLTHVGGNGGTGTEELCTRLAARFPEVEVAAGGGVRDVGDVIRLQRCGVKAVLAASALHDGRIRREDLSRIARPV